MTVLQALEERFQEINARAQLYSLHNPNPFTRTVLDSERHGALEMLNVAREAAQDETLEKALRALVHGLCSGDEAPEVLYERVYAMLPNTLSKTGEF